MKYNPRLTEQQINMVDDALRCYFDAHLDLEGEQQACRDLLDLITETRTVLAQSLPCSVCQERTYKGSWVTRRMGFHSDLCSEHYAQLTRGELKVRVA